jgi:hypothetical protein
MTRPTLTREQEATLARPGYARELRLLTPDPQRLVPLIGQLRFELDGAESGAPQTDTVQPLADADPWDAVADALGTDDPQALVDGWVDLVVVLKLAAQFGQIAPGAYPLRNVTAARIQDLVSGYGDMTPERAGFDANGDVLLTPAHIRLQRNLQWQWTFDDGAEAVVARGGWPGPAADPKRVYGNMSFIALDMHRILELPIELRTPEGYIDLTETQLAEVMALHVTLQAATQVYVENVTLDLTTPEVAEVLAIWEGRAAN